MDVGAQNVVRRGEDISRIGNIGYYGPDVAALTPMQQMSMQNIANQAAAFGLLAPTDVTAGMPQAVDYGMVSGYSSGDLYDMAMRELAQRRPEQYQAISRQFTGMPDYSSPDYRPAGPPLISPKEIYDGRVPDLSNTGSPYKRSKRGVMR
jgi:hypothetical protein